MPEVFTRESACICNTSGKCVGMLTIAECFYQIPMQDFIGDLRYRQQKFWREADALSPQEVNRKEVTYHRWCGKPLN
eukprot:451064-Pelagomonas_calceolata.AAC.2